MKPKLWLKTKYYAMIMIQTYEFHCIPGILIDILESYECVKILPSHHNEITLKLFGLPGIIFKENREIGIKQSRCAKVVFH